MSNRAIQLTGDALPYKVTAGRVLIAGERLENIIMEQFGKDAATIDMEIILKEKTPQLQVVNLSISEEESHVPEEETYFEDEYVTPAYEVAEESEVSEHE